MANILEEKNLKFLGISSSNSYRIYVETEEQAKNIVNNLDVLGLKKEEVEIIVVGKIEPLFEVKTLSIFPKVLALSNPLWKVKRINGGMSSGSLDYLITGTLGIVNNEYKAISCWHVYKDSKNIVVPGPLDGGVSLEDKVGYVEEYYDVTKGYDISIADISEIKNKIEIKTMHIDGFNVKGFGEAEIGEEVKKVGRTTDLTFGKVIDKNVLVVMDYPGIKNVKLYNCYITTSFAKAGDSGSVALNKDNEAIGLVTAGNEMITILSSSEMLKKFI